MLGESSKNPSTLESQIQWNRKLQPWLLCPPISRPLSIACQPMDEKYGNRHRGQKWNMVHVTPSICGFWLNVYLDFLIVVDHGVICVVIYIYIHIYIIYIYIYVCIYIYYIHISPLAKAKCSFPAGAGYWRDKPHPTSQSLPFSWCSEGPSRPAWRQMFLKRAKNCLQLSHHSGRLLKINNHFQLQNNTHLSFEKWFLLPPNSYLEMPLNFRWRPLSPSKSRPIYSQWLKKLVWPLAFKKKTEGVWEKKN